MNTHADKGCSLLGGNPYKHKLTELSAILERATVRGKDGKPAYADGEFFTTYPIRTTKEFIEWAQNHNHDNRKLREDGKAQLMETILNGEWEYNHSEILFDENGELFNGQTRTNAMEAVGKAGIGLEVDVRVCYGPLPKGVFRSYSTDVPLLAKDRVKYAGLDTKNNNIVSSVCTFLLRFNTSVGKADDRMRAPACRDAVQQMYEDPLREIGNTIHGTKTIKNPMIAAILLVGRACNRMEDAVSFVKETHIRCQSDTIKARRKMGNFSFSAGEEHCEALKSFIQDDKNNRSAGDTKADGPLATQLWFFVAGSAFLNFIEGRRAKVPKSILSHDQIVESCAAFSEKIRAMAKKNCVTLLPSRVTDPVRFSK